MIAVPQYGEAPVTVPVGIDMTRHWDEFMHYLYLPVRIPLDHLRSLPSGVSNATGGWIRVPERLWFLEGHVWAALKDAQAHDPGLFRDPFVYVTARRGFATPGNPLNRPGWHCDDFGGHDLNYIWADRWPTRLLRSDYPLTISDDDRESMLDMARWEAMFEQSGVEGITHRQGRVWIEDAPLKVLLRLSPYVVHDTPVIPAPGGMRSFFKISVSTHRYNLRGNSHNYLLDYDWQMHDRETVRNQPGGNGDYIEEAP